MLNNEILKIKQPDEDAMRLCRVRWDSIAKPLGSLGKLEDVIVQIAGIQRTHNIDIGKKALVVFCADNGVVEEGVSQSGQDVTAVVAENFLDEKSCAAIMARMSGADIFPVDVGMAVDTARLEKAKTAYGTNNMAKGPAMSRAQALSAIETGINKAKELSEKGYKMLAAGEMGIGNTTTSSAVTAVLLGKDAADVTGRGAGLSSQSLQKKISVINRAISINIPDPDDPVDVIAKVGGFDIAAIAGLFIGGAIYHVPVVMDGFISAVSALAASRIAPGCLPYIIASHKSAEPAMDMLLKALGKDIFLTCDMRLGEGSGAVALFPLLDFAAEIYAKMSSFDDMPFEAYERFED